MSHKSSSLLLQLSLPYGQVKLLRSEVIYDSEVAPIGAEQYYFTA